MDTNFWQQKWEANEIAFHRSETHPLLEKYFNELSLTEQSRIFLPLCGKTLDIAWLLSKGYRVAGAELSKIAIDQLFIDLQIEPKITRVGEVDHYSAKDIDIFVGNIFDLSGEMLGHVDAIYDRAALVALPEEMRHKYSAHLMEITKRAPQLLICFDYDQSLMDGPPFSVSNEEVAEHYKDKYQLTLLASLDMPDGLKGVSAKEIVWLLK